MKSIGFNYRKHYNNWTKLHSEKDYEDYVDNYIQIGTDKILRPYTRILNGHNTEYCDKSQTNIKDEFYGYRFDPQGVFTRWSAPVPDA